MNKVEEYMFKAGEEAIKSSATSEAIGYYQKALELYVTKYGADVDSLKIARMEAKICKALSAKGKLVDAINYGDRALQRMGIWEPDNRFYQAIYLIKSLLIILKHNYLSSKRALKTPTEDDIQIVDTIIARANALTIVDAKRLMVVGLPNLAKYCNYDISKSQVFFRFGVGAGIFFFAIGFFKIGKRMLDNLRNEISDDNEEISPYLYFHQFAVAAHDIISGQLKYEVDWKVVDQALAVSDYFYATSYLSFFGWHYIEVGDFELVEKIIGRLDKNSIEYNDDHARMDIYEMSAILSITRHEMDMARKFIKSGLKLTNQLDQQVRKVTHLGLKLQIQIKTDDLESALKTKTEAEYMIDKIGKVTILPFFYSRYAVGAVLYNLTQLENAIISNDKKGFSGFRKDTLKAAKEAVKTGYRFAPIITESLRYMAIYYWLINKQKKALKWFTKSIKEGERLGARPDLSRTYMEVGKRLLDPKSRYRQLNGIAAADYLEKARDLFETMDLWWDLEQLEKLKTTI